MTETPYQDRPIYTVTRLTADIKALLEERFPFIWVTGEISNFRIPGSRHYYFTLKDASAQIGAVMFRGQNRNLRFLPEDGMTVTGLGRLGLYEPRGVYQIIFEYLEPSGLGALQAAYEQLKGRLAEEGLFDDVHKKPIPFLPRTIGLITSRTGAVVHDILTVLNRRFADLCVEIFPVKVQGEGAAEEIVRAVESLNRRNRADVAILARGGGSLEDLAAFNSEGVARAVFASRIPIISAVGHETDVTIADFVADCRAPTPSAAAELAAPVKTELIRTCDGLTAALGTRLRRRVAEQRRRLDDLLKRLIHPRRRLADLLLRVDDLTARLHRGMDGNLRRRRERLAWRRERLLAGHPAGQIRHMKERLLDRRRELSIHLRGYLAHRRSCLQDLTTRLAGLDPTAILGRGYSITRTLPEGTVVRDAEEVDTGGRLHLTLARGALVCRVLEKEPS